MALTRPGARGNALSSGKPRHLHISHGWGGGLEQWVSDFARADPDAENLVLEPVTAGGVIAMEYRLCDGRSGEPLGAWTLQRPIVTTTAEHAEYRALLETIIAKYRIEHLYHSSLLGHSLDAFALGLPATRIYHDFYPWCPAIHCYYDEPCGHCDDDRLRRCVAGNEAMMPFNQSAEGWLAVRRRYLELMTNPELAHVCPSASAAQVLRRLEPRFESVPFTIIEHGIAHPPRDAFGGAADGRRLRVGFLGRLHITKGLRILERIFDLARTIADLHFIGCGGMPPALEHRWATVVVPRYAPEALPDILARHRLDLALFLSVVPETFSYALSEVVAHRIPPAARRLGSFEDRIRDGEDGFLLGPTDEDVIRFLLAVDADRNLLRNVSARLADKPTRNLAEMVADYRRLREGGARSSAARERTAPPAAAR